LEGPSRGKLAGGGARGAAGGLCWCWGPAEAKATGWQGCPAVEKAARWLADGQALPGVGAVGFVYSVENVECVKSRGKGVASGVMWAGQQGASSDREGMGKAWAVGSMGGGGGSRRLSQWVAG